jgi:hypothetical protein
LPDGSTGITDYCCTKAGCKQDGSVSCPSTNLTGYSCMSPSTPDQFQSGLACPSAPTGGGTGTTYCCTTVPAGTCSFDLSVTCGANQVGYSCGGTETPAQASSALSCTPVSGGNGKTEYCCNVPTGCTSGGFACGQFSSDYNFVCTGSSMPTGVTVCGTGVPLGGNMTSYCCY